MSRTDWPIKEHHAAMLAAESAPVVKDPGGRLKVALLHPNTYTVGMANLGLQTVYDLVNRRADALCERVFLPGRQLAALYQKAGSPLLSLEGNRPLDQFDLLLTTIPFENDAPNLAAMMELAGLPARAAERQGPLLVAGGVAVMLNPEPLADMVDGVQMGEAEVALYPLLDQFQALAGMGREEMLLRLAREVPGFYAPRFYQPEYDDMGRLTAFNPLAEAPPRIAVPRYHGPAAGLAKSVTRANGPQFGDMQLLEVGRGCGHACRFCAAGHVYRPPRLGTAGDFLPAALAGAANGGRVGLVSAAVSDLPGVEDLAAAVVAAGGEISVSSLRADKITPELAAALAKSGHQTVALAPEAGSPRLRRVINKGIEEEDIFRAVETLVTAGVPNLRLYFMLGLPTETPEDIDSLIALVKEVRAQVVSHSRAAGYLGQVTASLSCFVPKPFTPFQWEAMAPESHLKKTLARVEKELKPLANLRVTCDLPKYARLQAVLARGDRKAGALTLHLAKDGNPARAYKAAGVDPAFYANRARERDELMPWSFVDNGLSMDYLWAERERALAEKASPACRPETCTRCGICPTIKTQA